MKNVQICQSLVENTVLFSGHGVVC